MSDLREDIIEAVGRYFGLKPDEENGAYDYGSYDFQAGCYLNGAKDEWGDTVFLNLAKVVDCVENFVYDYDPEDYED